MITQQELRRRLERLNPEVKIFNYSDREVNGIYFRGTPVCAVPRGRIYEWADPLYTDSVGRMHRGLRDIANKLADAGAMHPRKKEVLINKDYTSQEYDS